MSAPLQIRSIDPSRAAQLQRNQSNESKDPIDRVGREPDTFERTTTETHAAVGPAPETDAQGKPLTDDEQRELKQLRQRDQEVRTHEQAHVSGAGSLSRGGPNYTLKLGPDGKRYASGGHVDIDTSEGRTPQETIQKSAQIRRAALAPADPSSKDRQVAAKAARMEAKARQELAAESNTTDSAHKHDASIDTFA